MSTPKKSSFKPGQYSLRAKGNEVKKTLNSTSNMQMKGNKSRFDLDDTIVTKDGSDVLKIDVNALNDALTELRNNASKEIRELNGSTYDKYRTMVSYVNLLYDTDYYTVLHDLVKAKFADLKDIKPGTVGAYFAGCLLNPELPGFPKGCSPICSGSMPPPKDKIDQLQWGFCDNTVIWSTYSPQTQKFEFTTLNTVPTQRGFGSKDPVPNSDRALIFVNYNNINSFPGFTDDEKNILTNMGIRNVQLLGYTQNGEKYISLTPENTYVPLSSVKSKVSVVPSLFGTGSSDPDRLRVGTTTPVTNTENGIVNAQQNGVDNINATVTRGSSNKTALILFVVIIVLVILFLAWRAWSRRG